MFMTTPMFRLLLSLCFVALLYTSGLTQEKRLIDKVAGTVGAEVILLSDIESQLAYMKAQRGSLPPDARCMILDNLLGQNLLLHQARLDSIQITEDEVEAQISARVDRILALMNNDYQQFEDYYGKTVSEIRGEFREPIQLPYFIAGTLKLDTDKEQQVLAANSRQEALELIHRFLSHELEVQQVRQRISSQVQSEMSKDQRQYDHELSLSGSLMYLADNGFSPYFAYAESFEVLPGIDPNTRNSYKPLEGKL